MHIGFVTHHFYPETGARAVRAHDLGRVWRDLGHDVSIVSALAMGPDGHLLDGYRGRRSLVETVDGLTVYRKWAYPSAQRRAIPMGLNHASFALHVVAAALVRRVPHPDIWVATSPTLFAAWAGAALARFQRKPWVMDVRDLWPDYFPEMGIVANGAILKGLYRLEAYLYRRASAIVTIAESARGRLIEGKGVDAEKVHVVTNGADLDQFNGDGHDDRVPRARLGLEGKFVVGYVGNHGLGQNLEAVVAAAQRLRDAPDVHFLFVGDGGEKANVVRRAEESRLANVTFVPTQPRAEIPQYYRAADVCLVPLADVPSFRNTIPSKIFEILACGRLIIGALRGEGAEVIERSGAGFLVPPAQPDALADAVLRMRALSAEERAALGRRGSRFVRENYDRRTLAARYADILEDVLRRSARLASRPLKV